MNQEKNTFKKIIVCAISLLLAGVMAGCSVIPGLSGESKATPEETIEIEQTPIILTLATTPELTPEPTEEVSEKPVEEAEDTPIPTTFAFKASDNLPIPGSTYVLQKGMPYAIGGTVYAQNPITKLSAVITSKDGKEEASYEVKYDAADAITKTDILDVTFSDDIDCLSEQIKFQKLDVGEHVINISVEDSVGNSERLVSSTFSIKNNSWIQLIPNNFRNNFQSALKFFGSEERFLFKFQFTEGVHITLDNDWSGKYVGKAKCLDGKEWQVHVDAAPYFEKACQYLENTYIHVHGTNGDSKALQLSKIVENDGTMVRRTTGDKLFISHHSLGTTIDINAHYEPNKNHLYNRQKIYDDVTQNLVYNGIEEVDGVKCYDFTYSGKSKELSNKIPQMIANYLIYELAFFRAGFSWGVYYPHTSDAMHFSLTELSPDLFEKGDYAMRKVFDYIDGETGNVEKADDADQAEETNE